MATTEEPPWVVADAGPIIHLDELVALDVLGDYPKILVPGSVWDEIAHHRPQALSHPGVRLITTETPPASPLVSSLTSLYCLYRGERDALSLCLHLDVASLLSDDTAARLAAISLGIKSHGTLGLLIRAARRRLRSPWEVLGLLQALPRHSTLHLRPSLLEEIIRQLRGEWQI